MGVSNLLYILSQTGNIEQCLICNEDSTWLKSQIDHPSHDVANGQKLVKEVYEALRSSPQWNETLLVITYDEHGGFYDRSHCEYN